MDNVPHPDSNPLDHKLLLTSDQLIRSLRSSPLVSDQTRRTLLTIRREIFQALILDRLLDRRKPSRAVNFPMAITANYERLWPSDIS